MILFIKTSFSLDPLNKNINVNQNNFLFVFMLVFLVLTVFEYIRRKEISLKIISITSKIQNHKLIENESSIIKEISFLITSYNDMLKKLNAQIKTNKEISYIDTLTQIKNRKAYNEKIEESVSLYKRYKNSFSIALLDIDDFKKINDTYGHSAGDIVLQDIAKLLVSTTRSNDMIFRIGGEEFIIIFPNTALDDSKNSAEEIRKKIKNSLTVTNNDTITVSIGITEINDNDSVDSLFQRIDTFLYDSKKHGKDQIISG